MLPEMLHEGTCAGSGTDAAAWEQEPGGDANIQSYKTSEEDIILGIRVFFVVFKQI